MTEQEIIQGCKSGDRRAQKALYDKYSAKMFGVCKRYVKSIESAEDVLVEAFYKVFNKIDLFSNEGSFEGWIRRVVVNESLMFLRKNYRFNEHVEIDEVPVQAESINVEDQLSANEIIKLLDQLPTGYRTVFNLYVLEGLKHKEIAELLEISINTSKSQLILAKKRLKELVENASIINLKSNN